MGNAQTKPTPSTAIDYEEDKSQIEFVNFSITEAPDEANVLNGNGGSTSVNDSNRSRLRLFSTFQSAGRPSSSATGDRIKLSEILANGIQISTEPGEFKSDTVFLRRQSHYEFLVRAPDGLKNLRILFVKNIDDDLYNRQRLGSSPTKEILMKPSLRVIPIGDRPYSVDVCQFDQEIYIPEYQTNIRRLYLFIIEGDNDRLLVRARAVIMGKADHAKVEYIGQHMTEREEKLRRVVSKITKTTVMRIYKTEELYNLFNQSQSIPKPPFKFILGAGDVFLAFRIFEPANRDSIVANLVMVAFDHKFLEYFAGMLSTKYPIRVILCDLRGFGYSGGKRGDISSVSQVYKDLRQLIRHVKGFSTKPIILGGHMFSAGMIINYDKFKEKEPVNGYLAFSPLLGPKWQFSWREGLQALMHGENKIIRRNKGNYLVAKLTNGKIFGRKYALKFSADENTYELNPMFVSKVTANYILSFQVDLRRFEKMSKPISVFMGEADEYLDAKLLSDKIRPLLKKESQFRIEEGKSGLAMLMVAHDLASKWILNLEVVKPWLESTKEPHKEWLSLDTLNEVRASIPDPIYDAIERGIANHIFERAPRLTDCVECQQIAFDTYEPNYLPGRPHAVMVLVAPRCHAHFAPQLSNEHRIMIVRIDPWIKINSHCNFRAKDVYKMIRSAVKVVKANQPVAPVILGGIGYGATLVCGYAKFSKRKPVNGYVIISPIGRDSSRNRDFIKSNPKKLSTSVVVFDLEQKSPLSEGQKEILDKAGYIPYSHGIQKQDGLTKDIVQDIKSLDGPVLLCLPEGHMFINTDTLKQQASSFLKTPFRTVTYFGKNLYELLIQSTDVVGHWVVQLSTSVAPRAPLQLSAPAKADFEPIEMIGKGTFGRVWLVRHIHSGRFLALKVLEKETVVSSKQTKQVISERSILKECRDCPFIVNYVGSFQDPGRLFLLMEFVIGGELFTRLNILGKLDLESAKFYLAEVILAIAYLHSQEIVYRDLKPENIVLDALGHIRLVDFGFARRLEQGRCASFCGSPFYIAPEMLSSTHYGKSVDIWALGILLFEMLTGGPPFSGTTANEVYRRILFSELSIPTHLNSDTKDLLKSLLDPSPDTRLGCKSGIEEIKRHRFFKGLDWERLQLKQIQPPFQPQFSFEGDTGNFMKFAGSTLDFDEGEKFVEDKYATTFAQYSST